MPSAAAGWKRLDPISPSLPPSHPRRHPSVVPLPAPSVSNDPLDNDPPADNESDPRHTSVSASASASPAPHARPDINEPASEPPRRRKRPRKRFLSLGKDPKNKWKRRKLEMEEKQIQEALDHAAAHEHDDDEQLLDSINVKGGVLMMGEDSAFAAARRGGSAATGKGKARAASGNLRKPSSVAAEASTPGAPANGLRQTNLTTYFKGQQVAAEEGGSPSGLSQSEGDEHVARAPGDSGSVEGEAETRNEDRRPVGSEQGGDAARGGPLGQQPLPQPCSRDRLDPAPPRLVPDLADAPRQPSPANHLASPPEAAMSEIDPAQTGDAEQAPDMSENLVSQNSTVAVLGPQNKLQAKRNGDVLIAGDGNTHDYINETIEVKAVVDATPPAADSQVANSTLIDKRALKFVLFKFPDAAKRSKFEGEAVYDNQSKRLSWELVQKLVREKWNMTLRQALLINWHFRLQCQEDLDECIDKLCGNGKLLHDMVLCDLTRAKQIPDDLKEAMRKRKEQDEDFWKGKDIGSLKAPKKSLARGKKAAEKKSPAAGGSRVTRASGKSTNISTELQSNTATSPCGAPIPEAKDGDVAMEDISPATAPSQSNGHTSRSPSGTPSSVTSRPAASSARGTIRQWSSTTPTFAQRRPLAAQSDSKRRAVEASPPATKPPTASHWNGRNGAVHGSLWSSSPRDALPPSASRWRSGGPQPTDTATNASGSDCPASSTLHTRGQPSEPPLGQTQGTASSDVTMAFVSKAGERVSKLVPSQPRHKLVDNHSAPEPEVPASPVEPSVWPVEQATYTEPSDDQPSPPRAPESSKPVILNWSPVTHPPRPRGRPRKAPLPPGLRLSPDREFANMRRKFRSDYSRRASNQSTAMISTPPTDVPAQAERMSEFQILPSAPTGGRSNSPPEQKALPEGQLPKNNNLTSNEARPVLKSDDLETETVAEPQNASEQFQEPSTSLAQVNKTAIKKDDTTDTVAMQDPNNTKVQEATDEAAKSVVSIHAQSEPALTQPRQAKHEQDEDADDSHSVTSNQTANTFGTLDMGQITEGADRLLLLAAGADDPNFDMSPLPPIPLLPEPVLVAPEPTTSVTSDNEPETAPENARKQESTVKTKLKSSFMIKLAISTDKLQKLAEDIAADPTSDKPAWTAVNRSIQPPPASRQSQAAGRRPRNSRSATTQPANPPKPIPMPQPYRRPDAAESVSGPGSPATAPTKTTLSSAEQLAYARKIAEGKRYARQLALLSQINGTMDPDPSKDVSRIPSPAEAASMQHLQKQSSPPIRLPAGPAPYRLTTNAQAAPLAAPRIIPRPAYAKPTGPPRTASAPTTAKNSPTANARGGTDSDSTDTDDELPKRLSSLKKQPTHTGVPIPGRLSGASAPPDAKSKSSFAERYKAGPRPNLSVDTTRQVVRVEPLPEPTENGSASQQSRVAPLVPPGNWLYFDEKEQSRTSSAAPVKGTQWKGRM